jgi:hypothetical protein
MLSPEDTCSTASTTSVSAGLRRWAVTLPDLERHPLLVLNWRDENDAQQFVQLVRTAREPVTTARTAAAVDFH